MRSVRASKRYLKIHLHHFSAFSFYKLVLNVFHKTKINLLKQTESDVRVPPKALFVFADITESQQKIREVIAATGNEMSAR